MNPKMDDESFAPMFRIFLSSDRPMLGLKSGNQKRNFKDWQNVSPIANAKTQRGIGTVQQQSNR